jgi:hypothetical protein
MSIGLHSKKLLLTLQFGRAKSREQRLLSQMMIFLLFIIPGKNMKKYLSTKTPILSL